MERKDNFEYLKQVYNEINNSFDQSVIFRVGESQGFHSEVDGMMQCMLWCYQRKIKFILSADDANFGGGNGWNEFFDSFCEENHDKENVKYNKRHVTNWKHPYTRLREWLFKKKNHVDYLTQDMFFPMIYEKQSNRKHIIWKDFGIDGTAMDEFGKMSVIAMHFNEKTYLEIEQKIRLVNLPEHYAAIQLRGGDKILETKHVVSTEEVIAKIDETGKAVKNLFIFSDDYKYVEEVKRIKPEWNIFTLTREDEHGYVNENFQKLEWDLKRSEMIKSFAMVEICLRADVFFGCEYSCTNNFIKSAKTIGEYVCVFEQPPLRDEMPEYILKTLRKWD